MGLAFAIDASYSEATTQKLNALKARGVKLFIQCLWTAAEQPAIRVNNLRAASDVNLPIAGYISLNQYQLGSWHMVKGRVGVPDDLWDKLQFVAIDIELSGISALQVADAVEWVRARGKRPIIYTSYNAWTTLLVPGNSTLISQMGVPLWNAYWDVNPDIDFPTLRYGGWKDEDVWIEQWSGGVDMELLHVDRNTFVEEKVMPTATIPTPIYLTAALAKVSGLFTIAAGKALAGEKLTVAEKGAIAWLVSQP